MSRRSSIQMNPGDLKEFVEKSWSLVLGTHGPSGRPHLATMGFGRVGEDIVMTSYEKSQKVTNIKRDPRVSCLIESPGDGYDSVKGVLVAGTAVLTWDQPTIIRFLHCCMERSASRGWSSVNLSESGRDLESIAQKRVGIRIVEQAAPASWDHSLLRGEY
jgi:hypothetical protein